MKDIKTYKKVSTNERGSKDLVFYSEGWENSNEYGFASSSSFYFFYLFLFLFLCNWEFFSICYTEHMVMR